jgi:hypothetical protein
VFRESSAEQEKQALRPKSPCKSPVKQAFDRDPEKYGRRRDVR